MQVGPTGGAAESLAAIQQKSQAETNQAQSNNQQSETATLEETNNRQPQGNAGHNIDLTA